MHKVRVILEYTCAFNIPRNSLSKISKLERTLPIGNQVSIITCRKLLETIELRFIPRRPRKIAIAAYTITFIEEYRAIFEIPDEIALGSY